MRFALIIYIGFMLALPARAESLFFESLYDVPVMPGLTELHDRALVFDTPVGTIAQSAATMQVGIDQGAVLQFYDETLPQLGWNKKDTGSYIRDRQALSLVFKGEAGEKAVIFRLEPQ